MAKLTISDAARACRVARSTLQRAVNAGRLSLDADHRVDTAELLRAGYTLHAARHDATRRVQEEALQDAAERSTPPRQTAASPSQGKFALLAAATLLMSAIVVVFNRTVWRYCYHLAETRFSLNK